MTFAGAGPRVEVAVHRGPPSDPFLVADIDIGPTSIVTRDVALVDDARGVVHGDLTVKVGDNGYSVDGKIVTDRGDLQLFGRRYDIDHGTLVFDGTLDPRLDIRIVHEFPELTLNLDVTGRASDPVPKPSGSPAQYTEGQLYGFLAGGEPGGDPNSQAREAAAGAGSSLLSGTLRKELKKVAPLRFFDVLGYVPATAATSAFVREGKWLSRKLYTESRQHLEARPDENGVEGALEYYFLPNFLGQVTAGDRNYDGADLLWRKRW
jgi:hypothetical protein